ncbi:unnamed protein product [Aphanomyces euteiches]|uniref:Uncharacterized protein n=1 Tax=Aphanomyces euteiches TaxID=100861 RepID=A0A6G0XDK8_9STRA|nr:hypothetical protein Ae201684_005819 [Aphanomyces euteiches]KAH9078968.1 hypothetical protein Ae201684P_020030 [Aphanomyces euteiches]KAH9136953.1 hypothetical protein AeRB84_018065 [Aphanomyces euteiches]
MSSANNLQAEYQASRAQTKDWIARAKHAITVRNAAAAPTGSAQFFERFAYNYGVRHVHTNSVAPLVHMILIVGVSGITMAYLGRHRHKHAALAAKGDHHDSHHH